jgi:hypothetical protein
LISVTSSDRLFAVVCAILVAFGNATLNSMKRVEWIRPYLTPGQMANLTFMLDVTRQPYNALLEHRREAYRKCGVALSTKQQCAELDRRGIFQIFVANMFALRPCCGGEPPEKALCVRNVCVQRTCGRRCGVGDPEAGTVRACVEGRGVGRPR